MPNERPDPGYSPSGAPWSSEFDDGRRTDAVVFPDGTLSSDLPAPTDDGRDPPRPRPRDA